MRDRRGRGIRRHRVRDGKLGVDEEPMDMRILLDENFWFDMFVEEAWELAGDDDAAGGRNGPDTVCVCQGAGGRWSSTAHR